MISTYHFPYDLSYSIEEQEFKDNSKTTVLKFLKRIYGSKENFSNMFLSRISEVKLCKLPRK